MSTEATYRLQWGGGGGMVVFNHIHTCKHMHTQARHFNLGAGFFLCLIGDYTIVWQYSSFSSRIRLENTSVFSHIGICYFRWHTYLLHTCILITGDFNWLIWVQTLLTSITSSFHFAGVSFIFLTLQRFLPCIYLPWMYMLFCPPDPQRIKC